MTLRKVARVGEAFRPFVEEIEQRRRPWLFTLDVVKGKGKGPGYHAPHAGRPGEIGGSRPRGSVKTPHQVAARDLTTAISGTSGEIKTMLRRLGWGDQKLNSLNERQLKLLATKRQPAPAEEWLRNQKGKFVTLYHGTARSVQAIKKEGVEAKLSTFANIGQEAGVFGVADYNKRWAEYWGNKSRETHGGGQIVVIEMRVPRADVKIDPGNPRSFMYTTKDVLPQNIVGITKLLPVKGGTADFKFHETVEDPRGGDSRVYVNDMFAGKTK